MQRFYWSEEECEDDLAYEARVRERDRHTWAIATRNGPTILQTSGPTVDVETAGQPPYWVERTGAAARLRAWRRAGLAITRGG